MQTAQTFILQSLILYGIEPKKIRVATFIVVALKRNKNTRRGMFPSQGHWIPVWRAVLVTLLQNQHESYVWPDESPCRAAVSQLPLQSRRAARHFLWTNLCTSVTAQCWSCLCVCVGLSEWMSAQRGFLASPTSLAVQVCRTFFFPFSESQE